MTEQKETKMKEQEKSLEKVEDKIRIETLKKGEELDEKTKEKAEAKEERRERPAEKAERAGIAYIFSSANNTMVHITDLAGNTLARVTGGMITKHSRLKSDPTIAMFAAKKAAERAKDLGINALYIRSRAKTNSPGFGSGGHAAMKTLSKEGFKIISILDTTRVPRGGPKKKGGRRGRRV